MSMLAKCIGCGCDDRHACVKNGLACHWLAVDYQAGEGVCSECSASMNRWTRDIGENIDQMMEALMLGMDGISSPEAIVAALVRQRSLIEQLAALCEATKLFAMSANQFAESRAHIEATYTAGDRLCWSWVWVMSRIVEAPTTFHMRAAVRLCVPLVAFYLQTHTES
ncbi:hypothetical protein HBO23_31950 [Pseudomonas sp. WS 5532]|uniref:hypothetical protein n=1 Tax=Pseudomonas sp. WS 5532 TaxID=2717495 RepID=UPI001472945D|nr:hypothetical protein [Pseudomonas sp. WS 5532]NMX77583.1 hypothetical protein [Pseudomonas sp. WS 5532]